ncbi:MAG: host attachment protein, partial [Gammaproteobacteria bacterium]
MSYWIIVANSSEADIYTTDSIRKPRDFLEWVTSLAHPDSKKKRQELVSDRPGHYKARMSTRGAYSEHPDPKAL